MTPRRVLVLGLAATGAAVVRHCAVAGDEVLVLEDRPGAHHAERAAAARALGAEVRAAPDADAVVRAARAADLVVPSPGVPERHAAIAAAMAAGVCVRSEIDLAAEFVTRPMVAVTGTNGKTTVTTLVSAMLDASGVRTVVAGNIGRPLIDVVDAGNDADVIVVEVSSFQLRFTTVFRPRVAVLLPVAPDHLDWHGSFEAYTDAKARIFARQAGDDLLVVVTDDPVASALAALAPARVEHVSLRGVTSADSAGVWGDDAGTLVDPTGAPVVRVADLPRRAPHDLVDVLAAAAAARAVGATRHGVEAAARAFGGLPHRVQPVGNAGGVRFVDDSKATNPHAAVHGVASFDHVVLLAGGRNKGLDLGPLRSLAPRLRGVVAIGEATDDVLGAFAGTDVPTRRARSMRDAVAAGFDLARPGDVVLLSPACASQDWYADYGARGEDFAAEVARVVAAQR